MGEVAEMMLDGSLCEGCGAYLGGTEFDMPLLCGDCAKVRLLAGRYVVAVGCFWVDGGEVVEPRPIMVRCHTCGRMVKALSLKDHARAVHEVRRP